MAGLDTLTAEILERGVATDDAINPFWQRQLASFKAAIERDQAPTVEALYTLGYWELQLPEGVRNEDLDSWRSALAAAEAADPAGLEPAQVEHAGALAVLRRRGLLVDYIATVDRLRITSSMSIARHYFYLRRLQAECSEPSRILEIGAGGGHLTRLAVDAGLVKHYVIVDLPEMLLNSCATLSYRLPEAQVHIGERPDFAAEGLHLWFLAPGEIGYIPDRSVDIALNFNSFMEMDEQVRDEYLAQVYRVCRPGALFYNVNRMQRAMSRRDGSTYENNPLLYPYRPTDRVIEWGPDEMQESIRARTFASPSKSFCITRIAVVA